jgi:hypothetical protein
VSPGANFDRGGTLAERKPAIRGLRERKGNPDAIVFVHGFIGDGLRIWDELSGQIAGPPAFVPWDCWTLTYATRWLRTSPESGLRAPICR